MRTVLILSSALALCSTVAFAETTVVEKSSPSATVVETSPSVERRSITTRTDGPCESKTVHKEDSDGNSKTVHKEGC